MVSQCRNMKIWRKKMDKHVSRSKRRKLDHEMSVQNDNSNVEMSSPILSVSERIRQFASIYNDANANVSRPQKLYNNYSINVENLKKDISSSRHLEGEEANHHPAPDVNKRRK